MDFSRFITWIKSHKWISTLIGVCLFLVPLLLVHLLYKWITPYYILQSDWDSGDLITYIAGFEAFIGSLFLGLVALQQTQEAKRTARSATQVSKQMLENEKTRDTFSRQPCVMLSDIRVKGNQTIIAIKEIDSPIYSLEMQSNASSDLHKNLIILSLINASPVFTEIKLVSFTCQLNESDPNRLVCNGSKYFPHRNALHIPPNNYGVFHFSFEGVSKTVLTGMNAFLELILVNSIGERYKETIKFTIVGVYDDKIAIEFTDYKVSKQKSVNKKK